MVGPREVGMGRWGEGAQGGAPPPLGATRVALRMGSSDWVDPRLVDPRLLVYPRGLVPGVGSRLVTKVR